MVLSESMDGGRIRLVEPLPWAGEVVVKLLMPVFAPMSASRRRRVP